MIARAARNGYSWSEGRAAGARPRSKEEPMFVYLPHKKATHTMHICPAADPRLKGEMPSDWVDDKNNPRAFEVEFRSGKAEVDDRIGNYLVETGLARKTKLILPEDED
jgi:hypothetical protein